MKLRHKLASLSFAAALTVAGCGSIALAPTDGGGGDSATGSAGKTGSAGSGATGSAGSGTTGGAGTGTTTGAAGTGTTTGAAGTGSAGVVGGTGTAGATGTAGTTGAAGVMGGAGSTGHGGAGGAGTTGHAGTTGAAGSSGVAGMSGSAGSSGGAGTGGKAGSGGAGSGGAGTGGMCGPVCNIFCQYGNVTDANGCPLCQCKPAPTACSATECGTMPLYKQPICQSGQVNPAVCTRGTDGLCAWHGPTCVACPALNCANIICTASPTAALSDEDLLEIAIPPPSGCPTCCGTPVAQ